MAKALWVSSVSGEFGLPLVYMPSPLTRELRKLYAQYQVLNKQIRVYKNTVQAVRADNGIVLPRVEKNHLLSEKYGKQMLEELDVSDNPHTVFDPGYRCLATWISCILISSVVNVQHFHRVDQIVASGIPGVFASHAAYLVSFCLVFSDTGLTLSLLPVQHYIHAISRASPSV